MKILAAFQISCEMNLVGLVKGRFLTSCEKLSLLIIFLSSMRKSKCNNIQHGFLFIINIPKLENIVGVRLNCFKLFNFLWEWG